MIHNNWFLNFPDILFIINCFRIGDNSLSISSMLCFFFKQLILFWKSRNRYKSMYDKICYYFVQFERFSENNQCQKINYRTIYVVGKQRFEMNCQRFENKTVWKWMLNWSSKVWIRSIKVSASFHFLTH